MGNPVKTPRFGPQKSGRPTMLTDTLQREIADYIRAGAYGWVAACTAGISSDRYHKWCQKGVVDYQAWESLHEVWDDGFSKWEGGKTEAYPEPEPELSVYGEFYITITQAKAQARVRIENTVAVQNPMFWLRCGPGKHKPGEEGWTESTKVELTGANGGPLKSQNAPAEEIDLTKLSNEELNQYEALIAKCCPADTAASDTD